MKTLVIGTHALLVVAWVGLARPDGLTALEPLTSQKAAAPAAKPAPKTAPTAAMAASLDQLLAPVALYPDALLAQMLLSASNPGKVAALAEWLASQTLKGTELQDAATKSGFDPSLVALVLFPQVVNAMAGDLPWTTRLGEAFAADRSAVFDSIQRLRVKARDAGKLKSTPQQDVETKTTESGQQVVVIEPANPQVVYVPQYNPQTVYTSSSTVVVQQESDTGAAVAAGVIGFTAGIAIGAAMDNNYYYGPCCMYRGAYMYNDAWDDYYDHREDAREDWMDHREDIVEDRGDRRENTQEQRTDRQENRQENRPESQGQRTQAQGTQRATQGTQRAGQTQGATTPSATSQRATTPTQQNRTGSPEARGYSDGTTRPQTTQQRSGSADAFSGYSSGQSERASSARGNQSRGSSRSRSGGGGGGGRRR